MVKRESPVTEKSGSLTGDAKDNALLASLGYKQEFKRNFTPVEVFGVAFSIIGLVPSISSVLIFSIPNGGASAMIWGWLTSGFFIMFVALALAELGSSAPTSAGVYYWTYIYSSPRWQRPLSWVVAYCSTVGNIASFASITWGCAVQIMAAASIGTDMRFQPSTAQIFGVYCALLLCHALICSINPAIVARLQIPYIVINVLLCIVIMIALPTATPAEFKNSAGYTFGNFTNLTNWPNGYAFMLSFLSPLWTIAAFESVVFISEEAKNATVAVPYGIVLAVSSSVILGWGVLASIAASMGKDLESLVNSPIGQPMATILFHSFGKTGTLAMWSFIILIQFSMGTSMIIACSRQIFAFARDGGYPGSKWLYYVSPRTGAPVHTAMFAAFAALLLGLLAFAGPNAIEAVFALDIVAQNVAYSTPIAARFLGGREIIRGPFHLGKFSLPVAVVAVSWMVFTCVILFSPPSANPGPQEMNYAVVVFGAVLLLATSYYHIPKYGGKHWFKGPVRTFGPSAVPVRISKAEDDDDTVNTAQDTT